MAVTAKFLADFSSFQDAVDKADVKLVSFQGSTANVERSLSRMTDTFSGRKVIEDAVLMADAVDRVGGVSKLTEAELQRVGAQADQAAAKMKAMGIDVPPGIQKIADASKDASAATTGWLPSLHELGSSWVARIAEGALLRDGVHEVLGVIKELALGVPEEAHALKVLSLQTQINVQDLQTLSAATREYGVDGDELGRALFQLGRRIAGGDESVATAYHLMGMSLEDVRSLNAMDLFLATERGLGKLHGTIRDTAAADLYGGKLGVSMGAFATGVDETMEKVRRLNTVAGTESVDALDEYEKAIDRATRNLHAWFIEMEGPVAGAFNIVHDAVDRGVSKWSIFWAALKDGFTTIESGGIPTFNRFTGAILDSAVATEQDRKATVAAKDAHEAAAGAIDAHGQAAQFMAKLELDAAKPLLAWQEDYLQHLKDIGQLNSKTAAAIGVTADQLKRYTTEQEAFNRATEAAYAETLKYDELLVHMDKETFTLAMEHEKQWREERVKGTERTNAAILAEFDAQVKLNAEWGLNAAGAIKVQSSALDILTQKLEALHVLKVEGISQAKQEQVLMDEYTKALLDEAVAQDKVTASTTAGAAASVSADRALQSFKNTVYLIAPDLATLNDQLTRFYDSLDVNNGVGAMNGPSAIGVAAAPHTYRSPGIQARAGGGDVDAGMPYMVGERGPELYIPKSSGTIIPNGAGAASSITITVPITVQGSLLGTPQALGREVDKAVMQGLRRAGVRLPTRV